MVKEKKKREKIFMVLVSFEFFFSYEHVLIPEAVNICPLLRVCVANVGNVKDDVSSLKLESVMKM